MWTLSGFADKISPEPEEQCRTLKRPRPPDLVNCAFVASRPNQLWVSDLTYVRTFEGWAYVAFVTDVFSRRIVGWQLAGNLRTDLPLHAPVMAVYQCRPNREGLIHHSDRGSQGGFSWSS